MTTQTVTVERAQLEKWLEALKKSDDFLYNWHENYSDDEADAYAAARQLNEQAIIAAEKALAQPAVAEQHKQSTTCGEPVAWMNKEMDCIFFDAERPEPFDFDFWKPLYTTLPQRQTSKEDALYETFAKIAAFLEIDTEAAQSAAGKPSDVFIEAIKKREAPQRKPLTGDALLSAAQSCLSPSQYDHFEALIENDQDAHNRLARAIENERGK